MVVIANVVTAMAMWMMMMPMLCFRKMMMPMIIPMSQAIRRAFVHKGMFNPVRVPCMFQGCAGLIESL